MHKIYSKINSRLDTLIAELHEILAPAEAELESAMTHCRHPLVLIVGAPRGGTTLLLQWLAASGAFAYPTNLLARLSYAPAIAARIQCLLTDPAFRFGNDLFDLTNEVSFESNLGKTHGALAPNEYWFFWRRFLLINEIQPLGPDGFARADISGMRAALAALEHVFNKALAMKGLMLQFDLPAFAAAMPEAFFLHIVRDEVFNAQSLLEAREKFRGSRTEWYSVKPLEYAQLTALEPEEQVIGQVRATHRAIKKGLAEIDTGRWVRVNYEEFCSNPVILWQELRRRLDDFGYYLSEEYRGPSKFVSTNIERLEPEVLSRLRYCSQRLS